MKRIAVITLLVGVSALQPVSCCPCISAAANQLLSVYQRYSQSAVAHVSELQPVSCCWCVSAKASQLLFVVNTAMSCWCVIPFT